MYTLAIALSSVLTQNHALEKAYCTIGRQSNCDVAIVDRFISRIHSTLVIAEEDCKTYCLLIDGSLVSGDRSSNGTWVNGVRIERAKLSHQDLITFGQSSVYPNITFLVDELDNGGDTIQHEKV